RQRLAA
ncbi:hypothetical protein MKD33_02460, partial [Chromobacterium piscinae]